MPQAYHTAVVVDDMEYAFTCSGLIEFVHSGDKKTVKDLGVTTICGDAMLKTLGPHFMPGTYDLLRKNCNSFSDCALFLLLGKRLDQKYTQLEQIGASADERI